MESQFALKLCLYTCDANKENISIPTKYQEATTRFFTTR